MRKRTRFLAAMLPALALNVAGCASHHYDDYEYARPHTLGPDEYRAEKDSNKVPRIEKERIVSTDIKLPNLVVGRLNWIVEGGQAHFRFKVRNDGNAPAGAFTAVAIVTSSNDPNAAPMKFTQRSEEPIPAHAQQDVYMAVINSTSFTSDTVVMIDPPTESAPGGKVWETNETDNTDSERWSCNLKGCQMIQ
jgi:hypothetical protein